MAYQYLAMQQEGRILTITLNRPETLNALTFELMQELGQALQEIQSQPAIRALILTGAGRGFCSGQDLRDRAPADADGDLVPVSSLRILVGSSHSLSPRGTVGLDAPSDRIRTPPRSPRARGRCTVGRRPC